MLDPAAGLRPARRLAPAGVLLGLLVATATACSGGSDPAAGAASASSTSSATTSASSASSSAAPSATAVPGTEPLLSKALDDLTAGRTGAAQATFEDVLVLDPANVYAHYNLGLIAQEDGRAARARAEYAAALQAAPDYVPALYNSAILLERSDLEAAVAAYRRVVTLQPDMAAAHMRLGYALTHQGATDEGAAELGLAVQLDPSLAGVPSPRYGSGG